MFKVYVCLINLLDDPAGIRGMKFQFTQFSLTVLLLAAQLYFNRSPLLSFTGKLLLFSPSRSGSSTMCGARFCWWRENSIKKWKKHSWTTTRNFRKEDIFIQHKKYYLILCWMWVCQMMDGKFFHSLDSIAFDHVVCVRDFGVLNPIFFSFVAISFERMRCIDEIPHFSPSTPSLHPIKFPS